VYDHRISRRARRLCNAGDPRAGDHTARAQPPIGTQAAYAASEVTRILDPGYPASDSLIIAAVEYFFHDSVVRLDYLALALPPATRAVRDPRSDSGCLAGLAMGFEPNSPNYSTS
jgi:hypothetical protein